MYSKTSGNQIKNILRSKSFLFAFAITLLFSIFTFFLDFIPLHGKATFSYLAAYDCFSPVENGVGNSFPLWQLFFMFAFPFICSLSAVNCYLNSSTTDISYNKLSHSEKQHYLTVSNISTFFVGFFTVFVPLLVNQLLWMLAAPLTSANRTINGSLIKVMFLPSLYQNHPYAFNLVYMALTAFIGGLFALLSFSISLYYQKRKLLIITLPGLINIICIFIISLFNRQYLVLSNYLLPIKEATLFLWVLIPILILINLLALFIKTKLCGDKLHP